MEIRKARLSDAPGLADFWMEFIDVHDRLVFDASPHKKSRRKMVDNVKDRFAEWAVKCIRSPKSNILLAVEGGIVGFCVANIKKNIPIFALREYGYISDLYVQESFQGNRISSMLKDAIIEWFKYKGMRYAVLDMAAENRCAHAIYRKWGFEDELVQMWKKL